MEEVTSTLDSRKSVDIIYLNFVKAFDKVPYKNEIPMVLRNFLNYGYNLGFQVKDRK